jgi:hypothetical protein
VRRQTSTPAGGVVAGTLSSVSWPWLLLIAVAAAVVVAAELPRLDSRFGADARRKRERQRRKATLHVIQGEEVDDFEESVRRDLESLPTIEEPRSKRP